MAREDDEEVLRGGAVNPSVVRIGDTVRRTPSEATPAVHDLLRHLEAKGFDGAPRALGFDEVGREVLTFVYGDVSLDDAWPDVLREDSGLVAVVHLLMRFHDAIADYAPPDLAQGDIACHGDPGPWNIVWRGDDPVAFIDWDFTTHASPLYDLSYVAFEMVPLRDDDRCRAVGFSGAARSRPTSAARVRDVRQGRDARRADRSRRAAPASRHRRDRGAGTLGPRAREDLLGARRPRGRPPHARVATAPPRAAARLSAGADAMAP